MSESRSGSPIQVALFVLLLVGGGWYFLRNYEIDGLDEVSIYPKGEIESAETFVNYDAPTFTGSDPLLSSDGTESENPFARLASKRRVSTEPSLSPRQFRPLRIGSWALDGFGPTKFANAEARTHLVRVIRQFDLIALQQITSLERDLIPRLVDAINQSGDSYDFLLGKSTGPNDHQEQFGFVFNKARIVVDRRQTYTVADPDDQVTYDPLVAWFRAAEPNSSQAWTFSLVNMRIDLANAPKEVALLPEMLTAIRRDGRGEDDVLMVGLFQADDAYLIPTIGAEVTKAAVMNRPTDIFGKYQTSNILIDSTTTTEYLGRGGVDDYLSRFRLNTAEAETVSSHLPIFAEFFAVEGGRLQ